MAAAGSAVPGASDLGLGVATPDIETEEQRRKRLLAVQQQRLFPNSNVGPSQLMSGFGAAVPTISKAGGKLTGA